MSRPVSAHKAAALEDFRRGDLVPAVAKRYGVSEATAHRWRREATGVTKGRGERGRDVTPRQRTLHEDGQTPKILQLLADGLDPPAIAKELKISASAVRQVRARHKQT